MVKNKDRWSALSMSERADLISMYVKSGITNLSSIRSHYNKFEDGGGTDEGEKESSNPLLGPILKIANVILQSDRISDTQRGRLLEFAMRISGGNVNSDSVVKASEYVLSKYGRKALFQVLSTDTPVSDIVDQSIQESGYTMGDNYGGVAFSNDFWDNDDFIWNNAESDDFVDAYVKGTTPYESAGVIRVGSEDPGRLGRYSRYIKKNYPGRDIPTYQAHKDTLNTDLVKYLDRASTALETSTFGANADEGSYQEAFPFGSEGNRGFFDAAGYNIELVKGPDGKIYARKSDMYDFLPSDFNDKWVENDHVQGLVESVDSMGHPFIFRTPWFEATEENVPKEILLEYTEQNKKSLGGKINRFDMGGDSETLLQTPQVNPKNTFNFLNINQKNPVQQFQAAVEASKYNYSYDGMSEDLKNAWMQADEDYRSFSESVGGLESYGSKDKDTSEIITITAPNTDISKFVFNNKISKNALLEIQRVAELRNQDPYDILAHILIEASGSTIDTNRYFNTHNVIKSQINPSVLNYFGNDRLKQIKQFGIYKDGKTEYSAEEILKAAAKMNSRRSSALENVVVPESYIDAVALHMLLNGRDSNPAQKGYTDSNGTVKHTYLEMVDSAIQSLKNSMPNLFENL